MDVNVVEIAIYTADVIPTSQVCFEGLDSENESRIQAGGSPIMEY